jgi:peroxiredoxin 6
VSASSQADASLTLLAQDKEGLPLTCRAVFIIGPDKKLKLSLNYPASVGRNMDGASAAGWSLH